MATGASDARPQEVDVSAVSADWALELGRVESATLEFKSRSDDRDAIRKAIAALANDLGGGGGGTLLLGVSKEGRGVGVDVTDEDLLAITNLRDDGRILDRPVMVVTRGLFDGADVIRVDVTAALSPPLRVDGVAWVRPGPSTRRASADDERVLTERRVAAAVPFDSRALPGSALSDLDVELARSTYLPAAVAADVLAENGRPLVEQLASLRLCTLDGTLTATGLLVAGLDPSALIPGAYVQFVRYEGSGPESAVMDDEELRGNMVQTATALESLVRVNLRTSLHAQGFRDEQRPDYPFEALREVVMNALIHRSYESSSAPTRISWFADRIEISNPGGPYGQVREDNLGRVTDYRNPSLAAAMKALGYVNRFGRGVPRIRASLAANGNPEPEFVLDRSSWLVTLGAAP